MRRRARLSIIAMVIMLAEFSGRVSYCPEVPVIPTLAMEPLVATGDLLGVVGIILAIPSSPFAPEALASDGLAARAPLNGNRIGC